MSRNFAATSSLNDYVEKKRLAKEKAERIKRERMSNPAYKSQLARRQELVREKQQALGLMTGNSLHSPTGHTPSKAKKTPERPVASERPRTANTNIPHNSLTPPRAQETRTVVSLPPDVKRQMDAMEKKLVWLYQRDQARDTEFDALKQETFRLTQLVSKLQKQLNEAQSSNPFSPKKESKVSKNSASKASKNGGSARKKHSLPASASKKVKTPARTPQTRPAFSYTLDDASSSSLTQQYSPHNYSSSASKNISYSDDELGEDVGENEAESEELQVQSASEEGEEERPSTPEVPSGGPGSFDDVPLSAGQNSASAQMMEAYSTDAVTLKQCSLCNRSFNAKALARHAKICKKVFQQTRKKFKVETVDLPSDFRKPKKSKKAKPAPKKNDWRAKRAQFLAAVAGGSNAAKEAGPPVDTRVPCGSCGRKFNEDSLPRHEKICQKLKAKRRK